MGTIDAFQRLVWSPQFKQNCFPHRSKMGVLKSFPRFVEAYNCLKSFEYHSELPKKHQKRLRLFSLGDLFLKLYFSVRYNKNKDDELRNAFE